MELLVCEMKLKITEFIGTVSGETARRRMSMDHY
jgi:hypothetical protein